MEFGVIEDSITEATGFPIEGEKWFKKRMMQNVDLNFFLKGEHHNPNWSMRIPQKMLKLEWSNILNIVQLFFTCEGWYSKIYFYHMRF